MSRLWRVGASSAAALCLLALSPAVAHAAGGDRRPAVTGAGARAANGCPPAYPDLRAALHTAATDRVTALGTLASAVTAAQDPWEVDGAFEGTLSSASSGMSRLDHQFTTGCYAARLALHTAGEQIFDGYRVYWLRVPQAKILEAADHLGVARQDLGRVESRLTTAAAPNPAATADLAAVQRDVAQFDAGLGTIPQFVGAMDQVPGLPPQADMTGDVATLQAARRQLKNAHDDLVQATAAARRVVADLQ